MHPRLRRRELLRVIAGTAVAGSLAGTVSGDEAEPYDGYLSEVEHFGRTIDGTDRSEISITVGAAPAGLSFDPPAVVIDPGTTVHWEWTGEGGAHNVHHDVGEQDRLFRSGQPVNTQGIEYEFTFEEDDEGVYPYVCEPHRAIEMKGVIVVGADNTEGELFPPQDEHQQELRQFRTALDADAVRTPVVVDDRVVVGGNDAVHAVTIPSGGLSWSVSGERGPMVVPEPSDELVIGGNARGELFALDPADGSEQWRFEPFPDLARAYIQSAPRISDGTGYVAVVGAEEEHGVAEFAAVVSFSTTTGDVNWDADMDAASRWRPAIDNGRLFVPSPSAVYALDADTGEPLPEFELAWDVASPVAVDGDRIFFNSQDGQLRGVAAETGEELWAVESPTPGVPTADGDTLFVATERNDIRALAQDDGTQHWTTDLSGSGDQPSHDYGGHWTTNLTGTIARAPVVTDRRLYVTTQAGDLAALDRDTGDQLWWSWFGSEATRPTVSDGAVFVGGDSTASLLDTESELALYALADDHDDSTQQQRSDDAGQEDEGSTDDSGSGFGVGSAVAAVGGAGYLLKQRSSESDRD